ncbi:MAG: hypothetical protein LBH58_05675 [Tannerellaceae bacterium]|jgi:Xaa-Pro aminopeptidase|nr:hypothetical protein [Tannerellaceae bacterium]
MDKQVLLKEIDWPEIGSANPLPEPSTEEIESRIDKCRRMMKERNLTHLVVYGDREHFANLMYLTNFDPRFEEAVLILNLSGTPLILVGNESVGHLCISPLYNAKKLRYERYQPLSLLGQPRDNSRSLDTIFRLEGIDQNSKVGCIGWKYFSAQEIDNYQFQMEIPAYIVDNLRSICEHSNVVNASDILMSPSYGLRSKCSPYEIALFEFANVMASEGMKNLLKNFRTGVTDFELIKEYQYTGYPMNCHIGIKSSGNQHIGLSSPVGAEIRRGDPCSTNIGYWGSNICRAGWVAESEDDLPEKTRGYIDNYVATYFKACAKWFENMRIGTKGKVFRELIDKYLPFEEFAVFLNPGHLIHMDEWLNTPIYNGSEEEIQSGMYMQVDIIVRSPNYFSTRMEDGIVIADNVLRAQLKKLYPDVYKRCMMRREFMIQQLGFTLPEEVLPLSNMAGIIAPFFLNYKKVMSFKS